MIDRRMLLAGLAAASAPGAGAAARPRRTGGRDLEGVWTAASYTDLERPKELPRLVVTPAEAEAFEAPRRALKGMLPTPTGVGQAENEWIDRGEGLARVKGQIRSSWIVDPPDGQIPWSPTALARRYNVFPPVQGLDNPEDRSGTERCLASVNGGAPMVGAPDANPFQIVQTRDAVVIHSEKYHDARIVRLSDGRPLAPMPPSWLGDSVGRWEGDALVVETRGFRPGVTSRGFLMFATDATRVTERFTRLAPDELFYEFTIEDPVLFARPWRAEMVFPEAKGRIFEYACHEGNYSMPGILAGARLEEREAQARAATR
jgi:hypothetical protein